MPSSFHGTNTKLLQIWRPTFVGLNLKQRLYGVLNFCCYGLTSTEFLVSSEGSIGGNSWYDGAMYAAILPKKI